MSHEKKSHLSDKNVHFKSYKSYIIKVRTELTAIRKPLKISNIRQGQYFDGSLFGKLQVLLACCLEARRGDCPKTTLTYSSALQPRWKRVRVG